LAVAEVGGHIMTSGWHGELLEQMYEIVWMCLRFEIFGKRGIHIIHTCVWHLGVLETLDSKVWYQHVTGPFSLQLSLFEVSKKPILYDGDTGGAKEVAWAGRTW
jgi:hypothetical protein